MDGPDFFLPRAYRSASDLEGMFQVLQTGALAHTACHYVHTGDLSWWLFYPPLGSDLFQHTLLWDDLTQPGKLLGWMLVDPTWPSFELFLQPNLLATAFAAAAFVYAEKQAFLRCTAKTKNTVHKLWVAEGDTFQCQQLESQGFSLASWDVVFARSLAQPIPSPSLPDGFIVRPCRGLPELELRASAQYAAFNGTAPIERYLARFHRFMESQAYAQALDMVVEAPDGRIAAFCIAWIDAVTFEGHFEPVGTHPNFQRRGLGKAVLQASLQHLQSQGMLHATVCTIEENVSALALYRSVGFEAVDRLGHWKKELPLPPGE